MTHRVIVRRLAERHLSEAFTWYERQAPGLGVDFLNRFDETLKQIAAFPAAAPVVFLDYRRALLRRFPYGVFYAIEDNLAVITAVYHLARSPKSIRGSLKP